jgi:hypothetical protein
MFAVDSVSRQTKNEETKWWYRPGKKKYKTMKSAPGRLHALLEESATSTSKAFW